MNYIVTITSGAVHNYEHGALFAVPNEKQAVIIVDLLNKYSAFRTRLLEYIWTWDLEYSINTQSSSREDIKGWAKKKEKDRELYINNICALSPEFKKADELLSNCGLNAFSFENDVESWPEEVVFAYQSIPTLSLDMDKLYGN